MNLTPPHDYLSFNVTDPILFRYTYTFLQSWLQLFSFQGRFTSFLINSILATNDFGFLIRMLLTKKEQNKYF